MSVVTHQTIWINLPYGVEDEEWVIEHGFWLVMFEGEKHRVTEPGPS